uniref:WSC domain-containing protein n=1 Tax=Macrostomum lignano TaxID=282301 RepID=A0A1I8J6B4_9PLAT
MWAHKLLLLALIPIFGSFEADAALTRPDWNYIGCFRNTAVDFAKVQPSSAVKMTREVCRSECIRRGKTFFGLSGGAECSCRGLFQKKDEKDAWFCKLRCEGDSSQTCGGPDFTDVFQAYNLLVPKMPVYESTDCGWRCRGNYAEDCGADSSVAVFKLEEMYV